MPTQSEVVVLDGGIYTVSVGEQGPQGVQGIPGIAGGSLVVKTAGENLSGHRAVVISGASCTYASNTTLDHASRVYGVTNGAAGVGTDVTVVLSGELQEPSWNWTVGAAIYLGANGALIQSEPVSPALFSLCIGFAVATDRMLLSVGMPIILA